MFWGYEGAEEAPEYTMMVEHCWLEFDRDWFNIVGGGGGTNKGAGCKEVLLGLPEKLDMGQTEYSSGTV